jgi:hypothetical protein
MSISTTMNELYKSCVQDIPETYCLVVYVEKGGVGGYTDVAYFIKESDCEEYVSNHEQKIRAYFNSHGYKSLSIYYWLLHNDEEITQKICSKWRNYNLPVF